MKNKDKTIEAKEDILRKQNDSEFTGMINRELLLKVSNCIKITTK